MRNLIGYIIKYHFFLLFILLEFICFLILIQNNPFQKSRFLNFTNTISGSISEKTNKISNFLNLAKINQQLIIENNLLYNELEKYRNISDTSKQIIIDTAKTYQYEYIQAKVVNNSTNKRHNFLTLNKGLKHGIEPEMGVITKLGVTGVVNRVSNNFSTVISILNPTLKISAKIKKNNYYGPLSWEGNKINQCILSEIPQHVDIEIGDTIITSGHSAIFPEGILIGFIEEYRLKDGNFYEIKVKLALDMKKITYVNVIDNKLREEQIQLEAENENVEL